MSYVGWEIPQEERDKLLSFFEPRHPDVIAHHITLRLCGSDPQILPSATQATVVGYLRADLVDCLVVEIDGTVIRPDNKIYHITMSVDREAGGKPSDSNTMLALYGYVPITPFVINVQPKHFVK